MRKFGPQHAAQLANLQEAQTDAQNDFEAGIANLKCYELLASCDQDTVFHFLADQANAQAVLDMLLRHFEPSPTCEPADVVEFASHIHNSFIPGVPYTRVQP
jgi:hypothetical protein